MWKHYRRNLSIGNNHELLRPSVLIERRQNSAPIFFGHIPCRSLWIHPSVGSCIFPFHFPAKFIALVPTDSFSRYKFCDTEFPSFFLQQTPMDILSLPTVFFYHQLFSSFSYDLVFPCCLWLLSTVGLPSVFLDFLVVFFAWI